MIDLTINKQGLEHNLKKAKENGIVIPTIAQIIQTLAEGGELNNVVNREYLAAGQ